MADTRDFRNKNTKFTGTDSIELPKGTTAERSGTELGQLRYNTELGFLEQYNATGWAGIDAPPTVSSITGTINVDTDSTITVLGSNFKSGSIVYVEGAGVSGGSRALSTSFVNSGELTANTNASSVNFIGGASFNIKVVNPSGLSAVLEPAGTVDRDASWSTGAGQIAIWEDKGGSQSVTVSATDPDGAITYSLTSGSLPGNSNLNTTTGAITTSDPTDVGSDTSYPFEITATQGGFGIARNFSILLRQTRDGSSTGRALTSLDNNNLGLSSGNYYVDPDLARGGSSNPFLVYIDYSHHNGNGYIKTRTDFTNGIMSGSYGADSSSTNNVDKCQYESGGDYVGTLYGLGNVHIQNGTGNSTNANGVYAALGDVFGRFFRNITYYNFATSGNFTSAQAESLARWATETSPYSYQTGYEADDDNYAWQNNSLSSGQTMFNANSTNGVQGFNNTPTNGHYTVIHDWDSDGSILAWDGSTNTGSMNSSRTDFWVMIRGRGPSNHGRWDSFNSFRHDQGYTINQGNSNDNMSQNDPIPDRFILPKSVSCIVNTGGGCAYGYKTGSSTTNPLSINENAIYFTGKGY